MKTNDSATFIAGIGLWAVALVTLLIVQPGSDHIWWVWTCVAGIGGGFFGLWYVRRRDRHPAPPPQETPVEPIATVLPSPAPGQESTVAHPHTAD
ncbi:hypothetical protein Misp01_80090 [Microtetraspora sp. NBRC 13810]|nr:hypothetical protein Misp01_80090 [Microtetraspora sp. NBRC 13810]